ncbi:MAG: hypothetical protein V4691_02825 [Pseudomonadota bacterium]
MSFSRFFLTLYHAEGMDVAAVQNIMEMAFAKQAIATAQAVAKMVEESARLSQALLSSGSGGNLDVSV